METDCPLRRLERGPNAEIPVNAEEKETRDNMAVFQDQKVIETYNIFFGYVRDRSN